MPIGESDTNLILSLFERNELVTPDDWNTVFLGCFDQHLVNSSSFNANNAESLFLVNVCFGDVGFAEETKVVGASRILDGSAHTFPWNFIYESRNKGKYTKTISLQPRKIELVKTLAWYIL